MLTSSNRPRIVGKDKIKCDIYLAYDDKEVLLINRLFLIRNRPESMIKINENPDEDTAKDIASFLKLDIELR